MDSLENIPQQQVANYQKWSFLFLMLLTLISILNGKTTPFYIIYFFWWNELIHLLVDKLFYKKNLKAFLTRDISDNGFSSFVLMGIYWVFIVLVFGFIANFDNKQIFTVNLEVLVFQNRFFNINLIGVGVGRIYLHLSKKPVEVNVGSVSPNMIVLHISIILGSFMLFFIVKKYPIIFTPENFWGSALIIFPFLVLKVLIIYAIKPKNKNTVNN